MKKILGAAVALALIGSAAFAEIWVEGRGYVETSVFHYGKGQDGADNTTIFGDWDTGDSDVWVKGDWEKGGFNLNIDFAGVTSGTIGLGDWEVWVKPLDFLRIMASNGAYRVSNRYNSIIDKTESKWGTLNLTSFNDKGELVDATYGRGASASDDDSFKGYIVNLDFNVVKIDLGFNQKIADNSFHPAEAMAFNDNAKNVGVGARVFVPIEGILNLDAFFKMAYEEEKAGNGTTDGMLATFGAIVDVTAIENMGLAIGYIGHYNDGRKNYGVALPTPKLPPELGLQLPAYISSNLLNEDLLTNAIDLRFQYNLGNFGIALHNNATFALASRSEGGVSVDGTAFADKLNLGVSYAVTDAFTFYAEIQNYLHLAKSSVSAGGETFTGEHLFDTLTIYPRFVAGVVPGKVNVKAGLRMDFEVAAPEGYEKRLDVALPLALEVLF